MPQYLFSVAVSKKIRFSVLTGYEKSAGFYQKPEKRGPISAPPVSPVNEYKDEYYP